MSGHRDLLVQVNVLDRIEQFDAFSEGTLKRFATGDEAGAAGAFVDDGGLHRRFEIALAFGFAAGVDQAGPARIAVQYLIPAEINRMICGQLRVNFLARLAVIRDGFKAAVVLGKLLFDDVGLNGDAQMIRLPGEIGTDMTLPSKKGVALLS